MGTEKKNGVIVKGAALLAEPFMLDPNFKRSVIVLCDHHDDGSLGFIVNKPLDVQVEDLLSDFPEFKSKVYYGGPVATNTIHFLHNVGDLLEESVKIRRGIYWGGDFEKLKFLIESKLILPKNIRFYVGYSGWSSGQLNGELDTGSWVVADMHANYIFKSKSDLLWQQIMSNKGNIFSVIAQVPDAANWN
ncbi:MAG: YqgE/AlgH family protein [Saprospiraceae bacterium]|jgi:putative transcriptional regulator|nr:YqgE/AlgH family protein [Saprospiraceae bacterium]